MPSPNRAVLDKFFQTGDTGDFSSLGECFGEICVFHSRSGDGPRDVEDLKRTLKGTRELFPDMHTIINIAVED